MTTEFDEQLKARLLAFQKAHGITETGTAGLQTWIALVATPDGSDLVDPAATGELQQQFVGIGPAGGAASPAPGGGALPMENLSPEVFELRVPTASGRVVAGGSTFGKGTFYAARPGAVVTGAGTTVAEGTVTVGGTAVAEGTMVSGGTVVPRIPLPRGPVPPGAAALAVLGAIVVLGTVYLVVKGLEHVQVPPEPGFEYRRDGKRDLLPGGAPPPAEAPGATPTEPAKAPGTAAPAAKAPGANPPTAAKTPGAAGQPVEAPGLVDDPDVCLELVKAGVSHYHHIFPQQFRDDFLRIGIFIHEYTVKMDATKHIGRNGIHSTMDWNGEWAEFFERRVPHASLSESQATQYRTIAQNMAMDMMHRAGIAKEEVVPYRRR